MGRRLKLTKEAIEKYAAARHIGASQTVAAAYIGVSKGLITQWLARARELLEAQDAGQEISAKDKIYITFLNKVEEADAAAAIKWQQVIQKAALQDPGWARWMLRQRYPDEYQENVTHDGKLIIEIVYAQNHSDTP